MRAVFTDRNGFWGVVDNPEGILVKLTLMRVTTRIVLREKKL